MPGSLTLGGSGGCSLRPFLTAAVFLPIWMRAIPLNDGIDVECITDLSRSVRPAGSKTTITFGRAQLMKLSTSSSRSRELCGSHENNGPW